MARKSAREAAMKMLYQFDLLGENNQHALKDMTNELSLDKNDLFYIKEILDGCLLHQDELDKIIADRTRGWSLDRISKIDMSILRLALYEIIHRDDIPNSVSINEAVELAKIYGNEKAGSFINGILGTYLRSRDGTSEKD
ncbi:MAG TPA: transcription antitermination factor NusB [Bacillota bacterium]|nr:transcription antitermination factor NusB [Bacillota bacterium]